MKIWGLGIMLVPMLSAQAASFECAKARKVVERAICGDARLNRADSDLGELYQRLRQNLAAPAFAKVRQSQRRWLQLRDNTCPKAEPECLLPLYQQRNAVLQFRLAPEYPVSAAGRASGYYRNNNMELYAEAYNVGEIYVQILGAEPTMARWICEFSAHGAISRDGNFYNFTPEAEVKIIFQDNSAHVSESGDSSYYCGHGGYLSGVYRKQD
jgi:uncharacterized protein